MKKSLLFLVFGLLGLAQVSECMIKPDLAEQISAEEEREIAMYVPLRIRQLIKEFRQCGNTEGKQFADKIMREFLIAVKEYCTKLSDCYKQIIDNETTDALTPALMPPAAASKSEKFPWFTAFAAGTAGFLAGTAFTDDQTSELNALREENEGLESTNEDLLNEIMNLKKQLKELEKKQLNEQIKSDEALARKLAAGLK